MDSLGDDAKDPKSELQENTQSLGLERPTYSVVKKRGPDHAPTFTVQAELQSGEIEWRKDRQNGPRNNWLRKNCSRGFNRGMTETRAGFVALIGESNVGKSTLMNGLWVRMFQSLPTRRKRPAPE